MHRSSSLLAGALAALALPACGSRGIGDLRLVVASTLDPATGACGTDLRLSELSADFLRVSVRRRDPGGAAAALCDAIVPSGGEASLAIAAPAGSRVDLWVEAFAGAGAARKRLASGALLDVDPTVALPALRLLPSEGFRCAPGARLALGRAFHSATPLPGG